MERDKILLRSGVINTPNETAVYESESLEGKSQLVNSSLEFDISSLEEEEIIQSAKWLKPNPSMWLDSSMWQVLEVIASLQKIYKIVTIFVKSSFHR